VWEDYLYRGTTRNDSDYSRRGEGPPKRNHRGQALTKWLAFGEAQYVYLNHLAAFAPPTPIIHLDVVPATLAAVSEDDGCGSEDEGSNYETKEVTARTRKRPHVQFDDP
jgi:hypothetical protein